MRYGCSSVDSPAPAIAGKEYLYVSKSSRRENSGYYLMLGSQQIAEFGIEAVSASRRLKTA